MKRFFIWILYYCRLPLAAGHFFINYIYAFMMLFYNSIMLDNDAWLKWKRDIIESEYGWLQNVARISSWVDENEKKISGSKSLNSLDFIKRFIPSKNREEIIGDLYEVIDGMRKDGYKEWHIKIAIASQLFFIGLGLMRIKFSDLVSKDSKTEIDRS